MATTTITQFARSARDADGETMQMGNIRVGGQTLTGAGASAAMNEAARFVRIATDTAYTTNIYGAGTATLHPAGSVEFFPVEPGQVITFTDVV